MTGALAHDIAWQRSKLIRGIIHRPARPATGLDRVFLTSALAAAIGGLIVLTLVRSPHRTAAVPAAGLATAREQGTPEGGCRSEREVWPAGRG